MIGERVQGFEHSHDVSAAVGAAVARSAGNSPRSMPSRRSMALNITPRSN